jgi:hypothetical protein
VDIQQITRFIDQSLRLIIIQIQDISLKHSEPPPAQRPPSPPDYR